MTTLKNTEMFKDLGHMDAMVMKTKIKLETSSQAGKLNWQKPEFQDE